MPSAIPATITGPANIQSKGDLQQENSLTNTKLQDPMKCQPPWGQWPQVSSCQGTKRQKEKESGYTQYPMCNNLPLVGKERRQLLVTHAEGKEKPTSAKCVESRIPWIWGDHRRYRTFYHLSYHTDDGSIRIMEGRYPQRPYWEYRSTAQHFQRHVMSIFSDAATCGDRTQYWTLLNIECWTHLVWV
jgi:hypothetical protein